MTQKPINEIIDTFICDDVLNGLKLIPDESISLICTSPPYNCGIKYGNRNDNEPWDHYILWLKNIMIECQRVLRNGGRLVINIDSIVNHEEDNGKGEQKDQCEYFRPIYADLVNAGREIGLNFRCDICWFKHQVVGRATAWGSYMSCSNPIIRRNHEYLLVWSKGSWMLPGDSEQSDMTDEEFQTYTMSFWHINPDRRESGHPAPFPKELVSRCIKLFSYRGDIILDPFMGSGTTAYIAKKIGRHFIGIDNDKKWVDYAKNRLASNADVFDVSETYVPRSQRIKAKTLGKE